MPVYATVKFLRVSPWKVRRYVRAFKGKSVDEAKAFLAFHPSPTCDSLLKVLDSAVANAENNFELDPSLLVVKNVLVDGGPSYRRFRPVMRGRAHPIKKRTSHVTFELDFPESIRRELAPGTGRDDAEKVSRGGRKTKPPEPKAVPGERTKNAEEKSKRKALAELKEGKESESAKAVTGAKGKLAKSESKAEKAGTKTVKRPAKPATTEISVGKKGASASGKTRKGGKGGE